MRRLVFLAAAVLIPVPALAAAPPPADPVVAGLEATITQQAQASAATLANANIAGARDHAEMQAKIAALRAQIAKLMPAKPKVPRP